MATSPRVSPGRWRVDAAGSGLPQPVTYRTWCRRLLVFNGGCMHTPWLRSLRCSGAHHKRLHQPSELRGAALPRPILSLLFTLLVPLCGVVVWC